jgi:amino acid adenylation domain-containing protein
MAVLAGRSPTGGLTPGELGAEIELSGRADLVAALWQLAMTSGLAIDELLLSAWALLQSRYTGNATVTLGVLEGGAGLWRPRLVSLGCSPELLVGQWLDDCATALKVPARLSPDSSGESFLFHSTVSPEGAAQPVARHQALLSVTTSPLRLRVEVPAVTQRTQAGMLAHFVVLLEALTAAPPGPIGRLPILTAAEKQRILGEWAGELALHGEQELIHQAFAAQATRFPQRVAVTCGSQSWTYAELNSRAERLARRLRGAGVEVGSRVGVCVGRTLVLPWALLGILKAGGAYVPLDPSYPAARRRMVIEDAQLALVLCEPGLEGLLSGAPVRVLSLDQGVDEQAGQWEQDDPVAAVSNLVSGEDVAYVIFTSGSTGRPKGVQIRHRSVLRLFENTRGALGYGEDDTWTVFHSFAFDLSVWEIWGPLLQGGRLVVVPHSVAASPEAFCELLCREQVTVLNQTPAALTQLAQYLQSAPDAFRKLALRRIICGGEALPRDLAARVCGWGVPLWNLYGPTECTVWATMQRVRASLLDQSVVAIGRPIPGTEVYLLDAQGLPVPVGLPGELHIGGTGLALGYLHQDELTAERFIPHPFRLGTGARLYRTGDLARFLPDGVLEFLGRLDHQVKVRGFRIECGDIEAALRTHPQVGDAALVALEAHDGEKDLVAYCVPDGECLPPAADLRAHLSGQLPGYMIPSSYVSIEALPLSANGKLDRGALPRPPRGQPALRATASGVAEELSRLWEEVLGVSLVRVTDDFFELGGQSLRAVRLFTEIERRYGVKLPISSLLEASTPELLARVIEGCETERGQTSLVLIRAAGTQSPLFCVHAGGGEVVWYRGLADRLPAGRPVYGFKAQGTDGRQPRHESVEAMAEHYLREMRVVQPAGPYYLAGFSFGGMVAFEMARQLRTSGEEVALVALLDAYGPGHLKCEGGSSLRARIRRWVFGTTKPWRERLGVIRWLKPSERRKWLLTLTHGLHASVSRGAPGWEEPREVDEAVLPADLRAVRGTLAQAAIDYRPESCGGPITLFRCEVQPFNSRVDPSLGWAPFAPQLEIVTVPGSHSVVITEPWVRVLARKLQEFLEPSLP